MANFGTRVVWLALMYTLTGSAIAGDFAVAQKGKAFSVKKLSI
jgi:hypothetical protein